MIILVKCVDFNEIYNKHLQNAAVHFSAWNILVFYIVTKTKLCILFLSELRQISTNFN